MLLGTLGASLFGKKKTTTKWIFDATSSFDTFYSTLFILEIICPK